LTLLIFIKDIERRKNGATDRPRASRGTRPGSRYPSAEVRRIVSKRDEAGVYGLTRLKYAGVVSEPRASYSARATWFKPSSRVERTRHRSIRAFIWEFPKTRRDLVSIASR
jgi:hypothetical protein